MSFPCVKEGKVIVAIKMVAALYDIGSEHVSVIRSIIIHLIQLDIFFPEWRFWIQVTRNAIILIQLFVALFHPFSLLYLPVNSI
jgi:hypothetical protein